MIVDMAFLSVYLSVCPSRCGIVYNKLCGKPRNMPRPCTPHAAAQLQPIHALRLRRPALLTPWIFMIDRQRLALGGSVEFSLSRPFYSRLIGPMYATDRRQTSDSIIAYF